MDDELEKLIDEVIERITFLPDGSSHHVWEFPGGTTREQTFAVSPILFRKPGPEWCLETAKERGVVSIERRTRTPRHDLDDIDHPV